MMNPPKFIKRLSITKQPTSESKTIVPKVQNLIIDSKKTAADSTLTIE